jgi:beta-galactosidase GanA
MLNKEKSEVLERFVSNGGTLIVEDGFGIRQENTWCEPYNIATKMMDAWLELRMKEAKELSFENIKDEFGPYTSVIRVKNAKTLAKFSDNEPAIQEVKYGKGKVIVLGFSLGNTFTVSHKDSAKEMLELLLKNEHISKKLYANIDLGIEENRLSKDNQEMVFLFNTSDKEQKIELKEEISEMCIGNKPSNNILEIKPKSIAVFKVKK